VLVNLDELRLSEWMRERLRLTWAEHTESWILEATVIAEPEPPLNQADNSAHPLYGCVRAARKRWRDAAGASLCHAHLCCCSQDTAALDLSFHPGWGQRVAQQASQRWVSSSSRFT